MVIIEPQFASWLGGRKSRNYTKWRKGIPSRFNFKNKHHYCTNIGLKYGWKSLKCFFTINTLIFSQIQFVVGRGKSSKGFVAIDTVEFRYIEACEFAPPEAKPIPTTIPPSTVEPTEPPDCK